MNPAPSADSMSSGISTLFFITYFLTTLNRKEGAG